MKITRKQLRQIIQEEVRSLNEYERADNLHETTESYTEYSNLSQQKKQEWRKLEAALKPFGYESSGVRSHRDWPFVLFMLNHDGGGGDDGSADLDHPGHSLEIRIPHEWYEKGEK